MFSGVKQIFEIGILILFIYIGIIGGLTTDSYCQENSPSGIRPLKKRAEDIQLQIRKDRQDLKAINQEEKQILGKLRSTDRALNKAGKNLNFIRRQLKELDKQIAGTQKAIDVLNSQIKREKQIASKRLVALYKLHNLGTVDFLASADSIHSLLDRKYALEKILGYDMEILNRLDEDIQRVKATQERLEAQKKEKLALEAKYKKSAHNLKLKKKSRSKILAQIRNKRSMKLASIRYLKEKADALDRQIKILQEQLKNETAYVDLGAKPFTALKGLLRMPVKGKIIARYGEFINPEFNVRNFRSGIDIQGEKGAKVHAVYGGKVIFADWFKGYGNMMIIDHGASYYTLYANTREMYKSKGDIVKASEVIGRLGDDGPVLHFQIRHHGKPINPIKWLKRG